MKIPEKAPDWLNIFKEQMNVLFEAARSPQMVDLIQKANRDYLYWDKFKYQPMPEKITPEAAWTYLKFMRNIQIKKTPLVDTKGRYFGYWVPDSVMRELHYLDQDAGGHLLVDEPDIPLKEREQYLIDSIMEEAIASSQLEGAVTTRRKAKEFLRSGRKPQNRAEQMILNNYETIGNIKGIVDEPLTVEMLNYIQGLITKDTLDDPDTSGRFRREVEEEQIEVVNSSGKILHIPPPARELPERIDQLCRYANEENEVEFVHPIIKAIILHFWLAYDHPYIDGNGRTARALFYWYAMKNKYWLMEFLSISRIMVRAPVQYARAYLYSEIDEQDITYFISFHLRAIHLAVEELRRHLIYQQKRLREAKRLLVKYPGLNVRQLGFLNYALAHPDFECTVQFYKRNYGVVYQTARADLLNLVKRGLLRKGKIGKTYYFTLWEDIDKKLGGL